MPISPPTDPGDSEPRPRPPLTRLREHIARYPRRDLAFGAASYASLAASVILAAWATGLNRAAPASSPTAEASATAPAVASGVELQSLPEFSPLASPAPGSLVRAITLHTDIPTRPRTDVIEYVVAKGDTLFGIAEKFGLKPETVLWGNYAALNDDPHLLRPGQVLNILPVNGTYYEWQAGDVLEVIARFFGVAPQDILDWPGNHLDPEEPAIAPGTWLLVPGGVREFKRWVAPTIPKGNAGVGASVGPGACAGGYSGGTIGGGGFVWPIGRRTISGNDYWAGHLAIDIGAVTGDPILASDGGVVVFAGWAYGGYGNMVMIDHGNGWQTLYAHLSAWYVACGQSVARGSLIAAAGSTGNSTGPHLHFETRLNGGFVNPWLVLP